MPMALEAVNDAICCNMACFCFPKFLTVCLQAAIADDINNTSVALQDSSSGGCSSNAIELSITTLEYSAAEIGSSLDQQARLELGPGQHGDHEVNSAAPQSAQVGLSPRARQQATAELAGQLLPANDCWSCMPHRGGDFWICSDYEKKAFEGESDEDAVDDEEDEEVNELPPRQFRRATTCCLCDAHATTYCPDNGVPMCSDCAPEEFDEEMDEEDYELYLRLRLASFAQH